MPKILLVSICAIAMLLMSCERRDRPTPSPEQTRFREMADGIPLEYGRLLTATHKDRFSATLWFEQPDKTIIGVRVEIGRGLIAESVVRIPRN